MKRALLSLLLLLPGTHDAIAAAAAVDDEAWIESYMAAQRAYAARDYGDPPRTPQRDHIAFADLARFVGYALRVETTQGRVLQGVIESAAGDAVTLRVHRAGGHASFVLRVAQVRSLEVLR